MRMIDLEKSFDEGDKVDSSAKNQSTMTGFNASLARSQISNFKTVSLACIDSLDTCFLNLMTDLSYVWASSEAVKFAQYYTGRIDSIDRDFRNFVDTTCINATGAYNAMARANGAATISNNGVDSYFQMPTGMMKEQINGVVGMNIMAVRDNILPQFEKNVRDCLSRMDSIPSSIALFDTDGAQSSAYSTRINSMRTTVFNLVDEIYRSLKSYLETEINTIEQAKQSSVDVMKG